MVHGCRYKNADENQRKNRHFSSFSLNYHDTEIRPETWISSVGYKYRSLQSSRKC